MMVQSLTMIMEIVTCDYKCANSDTGILTILSISRLVNVEMTPPVLRYLKKAW